MKAERLDDAMLFDFEDLWASDHVKVMTGDQLAVYVRLLSCQWREGDLPADPRLLALRASHGERHVTTLDFVGEGAIEEPEAGSLWQALAPCYVIDIDRGVVYNERVRADRRTWMKKKAGWSKGGKSKGKGNQAGSTLEAPSEAPSKQVGTRLEPGSEAPSSSLSPPLPPPSPDLEEMGEAQTSPPCSSDDEPERVPPKPERDFSTWWPLMPPKAKTGKAKALKAWCRLTQDQRIPEPVVDFLDFLRETEAEVYVKEGGQFLPHGAAFVNARPWEDDRESYPPDNGGRGQGSRSTVRDTGSQLGRRTQGKSAAEANLERGRDPNFKEDRF